MENMNLIDFFTLRQQTTADFVKFVRDCLTQINEQWRMEYGGIISVKDSAMYTDDNHTLLCVLQEGSGECQIFHFDKGTRRMSHKTVEYLEIELILGLWKKNIIRR